MPDTSKRFIALAVVGLCGFGAWKLGTAALDWLSTDERAGVEHFENQVWIDRMPEDERDMIGHLVFVNSRDGRAGAVGRSSMWRHFVEIFLWNREGNQVRVYLPQERVRAEFKVRTWECEGEAPEPFTLCLEMTRGNRAAHFYSREEWVVRPHAEPDAQVAEVTGEYPALAGVYDQAVTGAGNSLKMGADASLEGYADAGDGWPLASLED